MLTLRDAGPAHTLMHTITAQTRAPTHKHYPTPGHTPGQTHTPRKTGSQTRPRADLPPTQRPGVEQDALAVCGQPSLALGSPQQDTPRHIMTDTHFDYHPSPSLSHSATRAPRPVMGRQSTPAPQSPRGLINRTFYECQLEQSLLNKLFAVVPRNHHEF